MYATNIFLEISQHQSVIRHLLLDANIELESRTDEEDNVFASQQSNEILQSVNHSRSQGEVLKKPIIVVPHSTQEGPVRVHGNRTASYEHAASASFGSQRALDEAHVKQEHQFVSRSESVTSRYRGSVKEQNLVHGREVNYPVSSSQAGSLEESPDCHSSQNKARNAPIKLSTKKVQRMPMEVGPSWNIPAKNSGTEAISRGSKSSWGSVNTPPALSDRTNQSIGGSKIIVKSEPNLPKSSSHGKRKKKQASKCFLYQLSCF